MEPADGKVNRLLEAAVYYASCGWNIFPLAPGQKTPITSHGCKDATKDESRIREWWNRWPVANIGLACGVESGVYVVDVDIKNDMNGRESLLEFPPLPTTVRQDTPTGGFHALFSSRVSPTNRNGFRPGIDIRGDGYYVVLPPSIHPNGKSYSWSLGCEPWVISLAEFPDFLRPATRVPWSTQPARLPGTVVPTVPAAAECGDDMLHRASLYLAQCDPAIQGQNGHNKLLWAAVVLVHGFLLSDNAAYELLSREFNPRCIPPWDLSIPTDNKDFCRKISEARKLAPQQPEGWLLYDNYYSSNSNFIIDIQQLANSQPHYEPRPIHPLPPEQEYQYLCQPPGLLGEICLWINSTAMKEQPLLSLACALTFLGALFGRKVRDELGSRTNLYCMGVAPSSAGKAHAMNQIRRLASQSGCTSLLGGDDIASDSAIEDRIEREPSTLFLWDEIGHLLSHIKSGVSQHHAQVVSLLMKLYSAAGNMYLGKEYAEREKQRVIVQPCCCIYGTSTMERFAGGISPIELQDGWLSRCLVFSTHFDSPKKRGRFESPVPQVLIDKIGLWYQRVITPDQKAELTQFVGASYQQALPSQIVVPTAGDADAIFINFDNEATEYGNHNPMLRCLWAKGEENARRIALIVSCCNSYDRPEITRAIAEYSCRLMRYILLDFGITVAPEIVGSKIESDKRLVIKAIESFGTIGGPKRDVTKKTQKLTKRDRDAILADLMEAGEIAFCPITVGKSPTYHFWTADNYAKRVNCGSDTPSK